MGFRLSDEDAQALMQKNPHLKPAKQNKYRNEKTGSYDSKKEAKRAQILKYMQAQGEITDLVEQPRFLLIEKQEGERPAFYTADFSYWLNGEFIVEDVKSKITSRQEAYVLRRKLMLQVHGIRVREI